MTVIRKQYALYFLFEIFEKCYHYLALLVMLNSRNQFKKISLTMAGDLCNRLPIQSCHILLVNKF